MESLGGLATRSVDSTLSAITTTSATITRFIRSVRAAHADLSAVSRELSDLRLLLELLRDEPEIPLLLQSQILILVDACGNALIRIDAALSYCQDASQWASTGKAEILRLRGRVGAFREALALVLEVVSLVACQDNQADAIAITDQITSEVDRLRAQHPRQSQGNESIGSLLEPYLNTIISCAHKSQASAPSKPDESASKAIETAPKPSDPGGTGLEGGLGVMQLNDQQGQPPLGKGAPGEQGQVKPNGKQEFGQFETTGPWYPSQTIALPFYSDYPEPVSSMEQMQQMQHLQQMQQMHQMQQLQQLRSFQQMHHHQQISPSQSSPSFRPGFPISQPQMTPPLQFQQPHPHMMHSATLPLSNRHGWGPGASSPSIRSEPFPSATYPDSPVLQSDRWSEPYQPPDPSRFSNSVHSRNTSIVSSSLHPSGSIRSTNSNPRIPSSMSQASILYRPGSESPGLPSSGALSPAPGFLQTHTPRSSTPYSTHSGPPVRRDTGSTAIASNNAPPPQIYLNISPLRHLMAEKGKTQDIAHIDCSPTASYVAARHSNKYLRIWSMPKNAIHASIKVTSYVPPQPRSREYFVRSHAILSENAGLIGITTHFGLTLDIYNFTKGGSSSKKVQVIDDAHRWAASQLDAYHTNYAPLVVYRPKGDRIDRFFLARHPGAKKPFWEDATNAIELLKADLPFVPKFPELAYSANSPFLVAAAGPRPGDPPRAQATILIAWQMTPVADNKLQARSPVDTIRSMEDDSHHKPYRFCVPDYPALQTALPSCLAAHGTLAVSIWIPANHTEVQLPGNKYKRKPMPAAERFILVWDLPANATRIFAIPNVQACISPDCRWVAYCDANGGLFVVLDVARGEEIWRWPDAAKGGASALFGQLENLQKVTVFEFSADSQMLVVGDATGGVGVYKVKEMVKEPEPTFELEDRFSTSSLYVPLGLQGGPSISELQS
ncbi:hypothetical protein B0T25DRAFT_519167 [Lasiosphaeria hispida]|uniref:Uncharacterized protein n=1 Tax=Lasiosphaeria hispida TaxID=260671 RepID=A0AAJ0HDH4_9PEZI|nr:hypothetical protein B0T25DRAFT_519167 [Lasiosphaeria hispida]